MPSIAVFLEVYRNVELAAWCVRNVRTAYPEAAITVISDGDVRPVYEELQAHSVRLIYSDRLWTHGKAGALWQRRLLAFSESPSDYLFKIDTDTGFYRPLRVLPDTRCIFGTLIPEDPSFIQGGFVGMKSDVALEILKSGLLSDPKLETFNVKPYDATSELSADDRAISYVGGRLGIVSQDHPEVASRWKKRAENQDLRYAVVHPCKNGKL